MLSSVPVYVVIIFVVTVLLTLNLFVRSIKNKKTVLLEKLFEDCKLIKKEEFPNFTAYIYEKT